MKHTMCSVFFLAFIALIVVVGGGCKSDGPTEGEKIVPITDNLFPLATGNSYEFAGFLVDTNAVDTPVPGIPPGAYKTTWTLLPGPNGTWLILDSTTVSGVLTVRFLQIRKDTTTGDLAFRQTLGPLFRKFGISYSDTTIWVTLVRPSVGLRNVWLAFDTSLAGVFQGQVGTAHLEIFGKIEGLVAITDSTPAHIIHQAYKVRTWRKISVTVSGFTIVFQDDATTAQLWLVKDIGPVQVNIAGDTENYGHFRILSNKNF